MRLSDLLDRPVLDRDGRPLGRIREVRLVQDGPYVDGFGAALRVDGVLVGRPAAAVRLGFHRPDVRGPWPLKPIFAALARRATYVPWADLRVSEEGPIRFTS
jgi:hypothetical protein